MRTLFLMLPLLGLWACAGKPLPKDQLTDPGALLYSGYTKPEVACYKCHGNDAKGSLRGPNLAKKMLEISDAEFYETLEKGPKTMPEYKSSLTKDEMTQILNWLASLPAQ